MSLTRTLLAVLIFALTFCLYIPKIRVECSGLFSLSLQLRSKTYDGRTGKQFKQRGNSPALVLNGAKRTKGEEKKNIQTRCHYPKQFAYGTDIFDKIQLYAIFCLSWFAHCNFDVLTSGTIQHAKIPKAIGKRLDENDNFRSYS